MAVKYSEHSDLNGIRIVAFHEAGHAVAACVLGLRMNSVNIRHEVLQDGRVRRGSTVVPFTDADFAGMGESAAMPYLIQGFSGPLAEQKVNFGYERYNGGTGEKHIAVTAICNYADAEGVAMTEQQRVRVNDLLASARVAALKLVDEHWLAIKNVATLLVTDLELSGDEVAVIVKSTPTDPVANGLRLS